MASREQLAQMAALGLNKSVDMVVSLTQKPQPQQIILRAFSLINMQRYTEALKIVDSIQLLQLPQEQANEILEIKLTCYLNTNNPTKCCSIIQGKDFVNRLLTPKLDFLVARAIMLNDPNPRPDHPAIVYLLRVLQKYPYAIEIIDKLMSIGAQIPDLLSSLSNQNVKLYASALDLSNKGDFKGAINLLMQITAVIPKCVPALVKICVFAIGSNNLALFDATAALLPLDELEIVDLRAARLKQLKKTVELQKLVSSALNADEHSSNAWIAFSHYLEQNGDQQRAVYATKKALLINNNSRRGYMRHGELKLLQNDVCKAQASFTKAHLIFQGIDSFTALVQCHCCLKNWYDAESVAAAAVRKFAPNTDAGMVALTLYGLAKRGTDPKKAIEIFKKALDKQQDNIEAFNALIDLYLKDSDFDTVEQLLNKYKTKETLFFYNFKLAELYSIRKDYTTAMGYAQQALQIEPENDRAKDLLDQLEGVLRDNEELLEEDEEEDY